MKEKFINEIPYTLSEEALTAELKVLKVYSKENIKICIKDVELRDISYYGCDAYFSIEVRDKMTDILLETTTDSLEDAFPGVDDGEEIYYFLEEKGIDFSEEYDDDYSQLPEELQKEFNAHLLNMYTEMYTEYLFEDEEALHSMQERLRKQFSLPRALYLIQDGNVKWIHIESNDWGYIRLSSDELRINKVYNLNMEDWIYEVEGIYFNLPKWTDIPLTRIVLEFFERDDKSRHIVEQDGLDNGLYPHYDGRAGDVVYSYDDII